MDLRRSVHATIQYAGFFHFPLTAEEVHYWLICSRPVSFKKVSSLLPQKMSHRDQKFRNITLRSTKNKVNLAKRLTKLLRFVPGLKMIALTGSVAAGNSRPQDDIDLFFITSAHSLWLVRPIVILLISLFFRRRYPGEDHAHAKDAFCPNLWMDITSLTVPENKQSLYTAHEVLQVVPILDRGDTYQQFLKKNEWTRKFLANAYHSLVINIPSTELNLSPHFNLIFAPFNFFSFLFQYIYMYPKKTSETVHLHAAYLHTTDYRSQIDNHLDLSEDI